MAENKTLLKVIERMPVPALIASPVTSKILWANCRLLEMYGVTDSADVVGKSLLDFIQAPQIGRALADLARVVAGQSPPPVTYQLRRFNGEYAAGQVSSVPMLFRGQPAMLSFVTDVSEREHLVLSLRESDERYQLLLDSMPAGVVVVVHGIIAYANRSLAEALGMDGPGALIGTSMETHIDPAYRAAVEAAQKRMLTSGEAHPAAPVVLLRADGSRLMTTAASTVIHWEGVPATQTLMHDLRAQ
jgi:PAS domain S-box-containing protein